MKNTILSGIIALSLVTLASCNNNSDPKPTETKPVVIEKTVTPVTPAPKTEISVGPDGAEVKTKSGTEVKVNNNGTSVGTKKVIVNLGKKPTPKN